MVRGARVLKLTVFSMMAVSCSQDSAPEPPRAPPDAIPESTSVAASTITEGTATGRIRRSTDVDAFRIATSPVTVGQYSRCVAARVCSPPALDTGFCAAGFGRARLDVGTYDSGDTSLPVTCVAYPQAERFCRWVGGRLPRPAEWQLAARGAQVQRHAWGNGPSTCDVHWRIAFGDAPGSCCGSDCLATEGARVGAHVAGASPVGVLDVLTTRGEVVGGDDKSAWPSCRDPKSGCIVTGSTPGAIDVFLPGSVAADAAPAAAFRCVWEVR